MNPKKEMKAFMIDNPRSIASEIVIKNDLALYKAIFNTDSIVMPKMYYGPTPFRVMCTAKGKPTDVPVILDREDKPLIRERALIFGCSPRGWQRSLTDYEAECLNNLCELFPIETTKGEFVLGYSIAGMSYQPYIEVISEEDK